jgi:preprotein translocase subunit SecA
MRPAAKVEIVGKEAFSGFERSVLLQTIDQHWREHLAALDYLRQGIHLRGYAQKNPKQEYKREAFELFGLMQQRVRDDVTRVLMTVRIQSPEDAQRAEEQVADRSGYSNVNYTHVNFDDASARAAAAAQASGEVLDEQAIAIAMQDAPDAMATAASQQNLSQQPTKRTGEKLGRNDPCYCGSGKKFKQCHGKIA